MSAIPIEVPVKASEAASLAELVFAHAGTQPLNDTARGRLAPRVAGLALSSVRAYPGSLERDPIHSSVFYMAADGLSGDAERPLLLRFAPASAPASGLFPNSILIGRMRPAGEREIVVNAIPFHTTDADAIRIFAEQVNRAFLPRPQGAHPAIAVGNRHPEVSLPAAFEAFRTILKAHGVNLASTVQLSATREMTLRSVIERRDGETPTAPGHTRVSIDHLYHAGLWAAIRAGWREGYNAEADHVIISGSTEDEIARSIEIGQESIRVAAGYTKFTTDTSRLFELRADHRHPQAWNDADVEQAAESLLPADVRRWAMDEFSRPFETAETTYTFSRIEALRLLVKFGRSLLLNEELFDYIQKVKAGQGSWKHFDFEPSIDEAETLTTPAEMLFYMHWLKARGRAAQLVPPNLGFKKRQAYPETAPALAGYAHHKMWPELLSRVAAGFSGQPLAELGARVSELAAVARHFNGTLSIHSGSGKQPSVLNEIGRATNGRFNYKISGELQLQMLDVLSEQPAGSPWRQLFDRMVARCEEFAARGAFGEESELAQHYRAIGRGSSLGNAEEGRIDGNLFLVFWLGNMVGSRDEDGAFFKDKLDALPPSLVADVRRRNSGYILWLARHLRG